MFLLQSDANYAGFVRLFVYDWGVSVNNKSNTCIIIHLSVSSDDDNVCIHE